MINKVSIPHRQDCNLYLMISKFKTIKVSIPHRQDCNSYSRQRDWNQNTQFQFLIGRIATSRSTSRLKICSVVSIPHRQDCNPLFKYFGIHNGKGFNSSQVGLQQENIWMKYIWKFCFNSSQVGLQLMIFCVLGTSIRVSIPHRQDCNFQIFHCMTLYYEVSIPHRQDCNGSEPLERRKPSAGVSIPHRQDCN